MIEKKIPWIVSAVLAALLIIVSFLWLDAVAKLDNGNLSKERDLIREYCSKTDEESRMRCQTELDDMTSMLKEFRKDLKAERVQQEAQPQVQVSTTTAP